MTSNRILTGLKDSNPKIQNIMIFISDALRWDYLPASIAEKGVTFKTVASSLFTAGSFASMVSGLYPMHHSVYSFFDRLPLRIQTLLTLPGYNSSLWTENMWTKFDSFGSPLHRVLRSKEAVLLEDLDPPFIYLEDEKGGHCPYGWTRDDIYEEDDCRSFYRDYGRKTKRELRERYQKGIERSAKEFEERIEILRSRNLLDRTLVIFSADHGQALGEYGGILHHGDPTIPECVYVPTVFIHPSLTHGKSYEDEGVLRHVDIFPTILDLLRIRSKVTMDGVSILEAEKLPQIGHTYFQIARRGKVTKLGVDLKIVEKSVWDNNGGYLIREQPRSILVRFLFALYRTSLQMNSVQSLYLRGRVRQKPIKTIKDYFKILTIYCRTHAKYGFPAFNLSTAKQLINELHKSKSILDKDRTKDRINRLKNTRKV